MTFKIPPSSLRQRLNRWAKSPAHTGSRTRPLHAIIFFITTLPLFITQPITTISNCSSYDHLDYETAKALQPKVKFVICGLGAGTHYEKWGYTPQQILEKDWGDKTEVKPDFIIYAEQTHHSSGRGFKRGQSLWLSFVIQSPTLNIYYSGDGGYDDRFKRIAEKYKQIDWAIMECGQYNKAWQSVHELPEEVALATTELKAKNLLPVHHSKFTLAKHTWNEPLKQISKLSQSKSYKLATPMIGETVRLNDSTQVFKQWWENVK